MDMCNFEYENEGDFCCFTIFSNLNEFRFYDLPSREELCEWLDTRFIESHLMEQ